MKNNKISLISFYPGLLTPSLRQIEACLQKEGFEVKCFHLGFMNYKKGQRAPSLADLSDNMEKLIRTLLPDIEDSLYIGISLTASEFNAAKRFTAELKKVISVPIVWGGPHPTAAWEQIVSCADFICIGEGEKTSVELAQKIVSGEDLKGIPNLAYQLNGEPYLNPVRAVIEDLDSLPIPATKIYGNHKVYLLDKILPLTPDLLERIDRIYGRPVPDKIVYIALGSRGCPNSCTYCNNSYLKRIYQGQKYLRFRSVDHLLQEIKMAIEDIQVIGSVFLADDNFTTLPLKKLEEFAKRWKNEIGLPFGTSGSPTTLRDEKIRVLAETGLLYKFGIGVESASERILKIYNRRETPELAGKAINIVEKYRSLFYQKFTQPLINYQFIFDNPYEKREDVIDSLRFISNLPIRNSITCFHLVMYPGSEIYRQAVKDGLIKEEREILMEEYVDISATFAKAWLKLFQKGLPRFLMRFFLIKPVYSLFDSFIFRWLYGMIWPGSYKKNK